MHITTLTCPDCGTIVAANVLERERVLKCPGLSCDETLAFSHLPEAEREFFLDNADQYKM